MLETSVRNSYYEGKDLGVSLDGEKTVFKLWSPGAEAVCLNLYRTGNGEDESFRREEMVPGEDGVWEKRFAEDLNRIYYDYEIRRNGSWTRTAPGATAPTAEMILPVNGPCAGSIFWNPCCTGRKNTMWTVSGST